MSFLVNPYVHKRQVMYASDGTTLYTVNQDTGVRTSVAAFSGGPSNIRSLGWDITTEQMYGFDTTGYNLYNVNIISAVCSNAQGGPNEVDGENIGDFANDASGSLFCETYAYVYRIDDIDTSVSYTQIVATPGLEADPGNGLATSPAGQSYLTRGATIWPITLSTGSLGSSVNLTGDVTNGIRSMAYYEDTLYAIDITGNAGSGRLITINPTTGVCTAVSGTGTWQGLAVALI